MSDAGKIAVRKLHVWQKVVIWVLRIAIGGLFVMSGFVKMIDPWGFLFKLEEYLGVWHMLQPRTVELMAVLFVSGYEFVLGGLLAMGCYKRVAPWGLLLSMVVMLPLTLYVWIESPVKDCGCFGEFWVISNAATFWKNVAITAGLIWLAVWSPRLRQSFFEPAIQWMVGAWISLYIIVIGLYGYNFQPLLDFRSYPVGARLVGEGDDGEGDDADYRFVYRKAGEEQEFALDELPDSTWEFVDRRYVGARRAGVDNQFAVYDGDEDVTADVIMPEGHQLLLVIPEPERADISYTFTVNEMSEYADSIGVPLVGLLGGSGKAITRWRDMAMAEYPCYSVDDTQLKELARGTMSLVLLEDGVVKSKNSVSVLDPTMIETPPSPEMFMEEIGGHSDGVLMWLNIVAGGGLLLMYMCQGVILGIRFGFRKWLASRGDARSCGGETDDNASGGAV